jgi:RND family efflux transporter MFP subunit
MLRIVHSTRRTMPPLSRLTLLCLSAAATAAAGPAPRPVRVQTVSFSPSEQSLTYSGTIQARIQADIAFRVAGKIIERPVNLGDHVTAGQLIARLDPTDLRWSLEAQAQAAAADAADAANASAELRRYTRLGPASPAFMSSEYDKRQSAAAMAQARLAQARRLFAQAQDQLAYTELRADADGAITSLPAQIGQVVSIGQTIATLAHGREIEADVAIPENRLPDIRAAGQISVALWSDPSRPLRGRLREIGALADPASRTFNVRITLIDAPPQDSLGMTAAVRFSRAAGPPLALLPASALTDAQGSPAMWVLDAGIARACLHPVQIAAVADNGMVAVSAGLHQGDQVVTAGTAELRPDLPVIAWAGTQH